MTSTLPETSPINALIFDLGGVLLNIDYQLTEQAFVQLGLNNFEEIYSQAKQSGVFDAFEIGQISTDEFVSTLQGKFHEPPSAQEIIIAWNAMLLDFPVKRLEMLTKLKENYQVYLISNTNELHYNAFNESFESRFMNGLSYYFHQDYYSHSLGLRKPNKEVFQYIIDQHELKPENTLFIDDSIQHIEGANKLGLNTIFLEKGMEVIDELSRTKILT